MKRIIWNETILEEFKRDAMLTPEETAVVDGLAKHESRVCMAIKLSVSLSTVDRMIRTIWQKYDQASLYNPLLPPIK